MSDRERGSGTVLAIGALAVLVAVLWGLSVLSGVVVARHRAESAADLAALAGAAAVEAGGPGCPTALATAARNGAGARCRVQAGDVVVEAWVPLPVGARWVAPRAAALARAGAR